MAYLTAILPPFREVLVRHASVTFRLSAFAVQRGIAALRSAKLPLV